MESTERLSKGAISISVRGLLTRTEERIRHNEYICLFTVRLNDQCAVLNVGFLALFVSLRRVVLFQADSVKDPRIHQCTTV